MIKLFQKFNDILYRSGIGVGTEVFGMVTLHLMAVKDPWEIFLHGNPDIRISLIIGQHGVVVRPVLFDEIAFQNQSLQLGAAYDIFKPCNMRDHFLDLWGFLVSCLKILVNSVVQIDGLAYIYYVIP